MLSFMWIDVQLARWSRKRRLLRNLTSFREDVSMIWFWSDGTHVILSVTNLYNLVTKAFHLQNKVNFNPLVPARWKILEKYEKKISFWPMIQKFFRAPETFCLIFSKIFISTKYLRVLSILSQYHHSLKVIRTFSKINIERYFFLNIFLINN